MHSLGRALLVFVIALLAAGCGRYYDIGHADGARGQFAIITPPATIGNIWYRGGIHCGDCPARTSEPSSETWASPDVGAPGNSLPRSKKDRVSEAERTAFDPVKARAALAAVDLSACKDARGHGHATITINPDGVISKIAIDSPKGLSPSSIECIGAHLAAANVAPFEGSLVTMGTSYFVP